MKLTFSYFISHYSISRFSVTHSSMTWLHSLHLGLSYAITFRPSSLQCLSWVAIHLRFILRVCDNISFVNILLLYWLSITITFFTAACTDHRNIAITSDICFGGFVSLLQIWSAVFPAPSNPYHQDGTTPMVCPLQELLHEK